jgi:hypothetical protein
MEMVMTTKKKEAKPAAKKAKAPKAAAKKSDAFKAWERRTYLYEKQQSGKPFTQAETAEANLIRSQRGDIVPGFKPAI